MHFPLTHLLYFHVLVLLASLPLPLLFQVAQSPKLVIFFSNHMSANRLPLLPAVSRMCETNTERDTFLAMHTTSLPMVATVCPPATAHLG